MVQTEMAKGGPRANRSCVWGNYLRINHFRTATRRGYIARAQWRVRTDTQPAHW